MIKPKGLKKGSRVAVVSLSMGILGESFTELQRELAEKRFAEMGLELVYMPNSLKGMKHLDEHPEDRAADLKMAFADDSIDAIITAIGGLDTYRTYEYLMEDEEFKELVRTKPKLFTGFSDTTMNHLMLNRLGLRTFYGPALLPDIAELEYEMLPYTKEHFLGYFENPNTREIKPAPIWYIDRTEFGADQYGVERTRVKEAHGFEVLNGKGVRTGKLYGGCVETLADCFFDFLGRDKIKVPELVEKYGILPTIEEWSEKILFLETATFIEPAKLKEILMEFKNRGIFKVVQAVIVGKPVDEKFYEEYKEIYREIFSDLDTPVLYNLNFGHSYPRFVLPYEAKAEVDVDNKTFKIIEKVFED